MSSARKAAEAHFRMPAKKLEERPQQVCKLPPEFQEQYDRVPESRRRPAFMIVNAPSLEARQVIWNDVPALWKGEVAEAVGLILGAMFGTSASARDIEARLASVPEALRPPVRRRALEVFGKRSLPAERELAWKIDAAFLQMPLREAKTAFERVYFEYHVAAHKGSVSRVAAAAGMDRTATHRKLLELGMKWRIKHEVNDKPPQ